MDPPPLFAAIYARDLVRVSAEASQPSALSAKLEDGKTALLLAAQVGRSDMLEILLNAGADINAEDVAARTALHISVAEGHLEASRFLLSREPALHARRTKSGNTPLHRAAAYGFPNIAALLLSHHADLGACNAAGATALHRAARWGHSSVALVLLRAGASAAAADRGGLSPPDWADAKGFFPLARDLRAGKLVVPPLPAAEAGEGAGGGSGGASPRAAVPPSVPQPGALLVVEGWMAKQGHFFPNWKNRWFVLVGRTLSYYTKQGAKTPQGVISLLRGTDLVVEERYAKPFCFTVVTRTKKFILQAANEEEMTEWIEAIQNNIIHAPGGACSKAGQRGGGGGRDEPRPRPAPPRPARAGKLFTHPTTLPQPQAEKRMRLALLETTRSRLKNAQF
jgi:hypothetical protein